MKSVRGLIIVAFLSAAVVARADLDILFVGSNHSYSENSDPSDGVIA